MASVHLDWFPPDVPNLAQLVIREAPDEDGPWSVIETVTEIGTFPSYISEYTTDLASSNENWFTIEWVDDKGATTGESNPIKGGTSSLISEIVNRVMMRDQSLDERVVAQIAEGEIEAYFNEDPYSVALTGQSYRKLNGLTSLVQAKSYFIRAAQGTASTQYTAGLVSQRSEEYTKVKASIDALLAEANKALGINRSWVLLLAEYNNGVSTSFEYDQSRLLLSVT